MGIFDGILICSDWDGTLSVSGNLNDKDIRAIRYFQSNGGLFTVCSGRPLCYLSDHLGAIVPNAYILTLNGAMITDHKTQSTVYSGFLDERALDILGSIIESNVPLASVYAYIDINGSATKVQAESAADLKPMIQGERIFKIVFVTDDKSEVSRLKRALENVNTDGYVLASSWASSLEIISERSSKGPSALRVKEMSGAKTLIAVGDYENDIEMLRVADISYAVGNASDAVKRCASRVTVSAKDGAIAAIISEIETELNSAAK